MGRWTASTSTGGRALATGLDRRTRRSLLGGLAGLAAGLVGAGGGASACPPAQIAGVGGRCICRSTGRPPGPEGCSCGAGQTPVNGACVDLSSDPNNCGGPGVVCDSGLCRGGQCGCPSDRPDLCPSGCTNTETDPDNCGDCGNRCPDPNPGTCQGERICTAGTCGFLPAAASTPCRLPEGDCDLPELCKGDSLLCPDDLVVPAGIPCRLAQDLCDLLATCDGRSKFCPPNPLKSPGTECRAASDLCDLPATCTGNSAACPPNPVKSQGTPCRASASACDPAEMCDGISPACPPDVVIEGEPCDLSCCSAPEVCLLPPPGETERRCGVGGGEGQPCRANAPSCDTDLTCIPDTHLCMACGSNGAPCCGDAPSSLSCDPGLVCGGPSTICQPCGGPNELCCGRLNGVSGSCDSDDLVCVLTSVSPPTGTCLTCGGNGEPCCGGVNCDAGFTCIISELSHFCQSCGSEGEICCDDFDGNGTCDPGLVCDPSSGPLDPSRCHS